MSSHEIPKALWDRLDAHLYIRVLDITETYELLTSKYVKTHTPKIVDALPELLNSKEMMEIWDDVDKVVVPESLTLFLSLIAGSFTCAQTDRSVTEPKYRLPCEECPYKGELCFKVREIWGTRWAESAIKFAKARAWLHERAIVQLEDILFVLPYVLNHRLVLKPEVESSYPNKIEFVKKEVIEKAIVVKKETWISAIKAYLAALKGDEDAKRKLEELAEDDVVVYKLYRKFKEETEQKQNGFEKLLLSGGAAVE
ncbi:MAG: hypothetical protein JRD89_17805 [Deltaproteobacteria bacterium]|nr:hypothetical protein [Deltaproteobacteria bacterium]